MVHLKRCAEMTMRIDPARIYFLKFILEGYDGIATLSTIDSKTGKIVLRFPDESRNDLVALLEALAPSLYDQPQDERL